MILKVHFRDICFRKKVGQRDLDINNFISKIINQEKTEHKIIKMLIALKAVK